MHFNFDTKTISFLMAGIIISGCSSTTPETPLGMANPASVYCEKVGSRSVIEKNADGSEFGMCHFSDGRKIEEWALYRRDHPVKSDLGKLD